MHEVQDRAIGITTSDSPLCDVLVGMFAQDMLFKPTDISYPVELHYEKGFLIEAVYFLSSIIRWGGLTMVNINKYSIID